LIKLARDKDPGPGKPTKKDNMKKTIAFFLLSMFILPVKAEDPDLPILGLCISAPEHEYVAEFNKFIREELAPLGINTLVLLVDWGY
jgi:hypothetical protein